MSEVNALELRITDNASQTSQALGALTRTLGLLKVAVSGSHFAGLKTISTSLEKIAGVTIKTETVTALEKYASALERIGNALSSIKGLSNVSSALGKATGGVMNSRTYTRSGSKGGVVAGRATGAQYVAPRAQQIREVVNQARSLGLPEKSWHTMMEESIRGARPGQTRQFSQLQEVNERLRQTEQVAATEARITKEIEKQARAARYASYDRQEKLESLNRGMNPANLSKFRNMNNLFRRELLDPNTTREEWDRTRAVLVGSQRIENRMNAAIGGRVSPRELFPAGYERFRTEGGLLSRTIENIQRDSDMRGRLATRPLGLPAAGQSLAEEMQTRQRISELAEECVRKATESVQQAKQQVQAEAQVTKELQTQAELSSRLATFEHTSEKEWARYREQRRMMEGQTAGRVNMGNVQESLDAMRAQNERLTGLMHQAGLKAPNVAKGEMGWSDANQHMREALQLSEQIAQAGLRGPARSLNYTEQLEQLREASRLLSEIQEKGLQVPKRGSLYSQIEQMKTSLAEAAKTPPVPPMPPIKLDAIAEGMQTVTEETTKARFSLKQFVEGVKPANNALLGMFKGLARVAKYRLFRYIITQITKAVKEGMENFRGYSKAIKGLYDKDMTALDNVMLKMKNSVSAAIAPAFQALIPVIQTVVNWVITASNYVTQFFALLRGDSSWSKALDVTASDFEKTKNSANGAAKAAKELLASWDELNIISQEGGGGGGGNSLTDADYKKMYEEVGVFDGKVKEIVTFIKDNMDAVKTAVSEIGSALLLWKVGEAIGGLFGVIGSLFAAGGVVKIMFDVEAMLNGKFMETGEDGWLVASALTSLVGATLAEKILTPILGTGMAEVGFGIAMLVTAGASIKAVVENQDVDAFSEKNLKQTLLGSIAAGYGAWKIAGGLKATKWGADKITTGTKVDAMLGSALMVLGVTVGIKAMQRAEAGDGWTPEQIRDTITSSIALGGGSALLAAAFGAGIAASLATGVAVALGTAAIVALTVYVNTHTTPGIIDFGGVKLTEDEIRDYVNTNMFTIDIEANLRVIDTKLDMLSSAKEKVRDQIAEAVPLLNVIKLDLDTPETLNQLKKTLLGENGDGTGGLIGSMKEELSAALGVISVNMTLFGKSEDGTTSDYDAIFGDFETITNWFGEKGDALGEAFKNGAVEQIAQITDEVIRVTTEMTNAKDMAGIRAKAAAIGAEYRDKGLEEFTQDTVEGLIADYNTLKNEAVDRFIASATAEAAEYESRAAFFRETGNQTRADFNAAEAQKLYARIANGEIERAALAAAQPGLDLIKDLLTSKVPNGFDFSQQGRTQSVKNLLETATSREEFESGLVEYWLGGGNGPFGNARNIVLPLLREGMLSFTDLFNEGDINRWINYTSMGGKINSNALTWYRSSEELAQEREAARDRTRNATLSNARKQLEFLGISIPEMIEGSYEPVKKIKAEYDDGPEFSMAEILAESAETVEETMDGVAEVVSTAVEGVEKIEAAAGVEQGSSLNEGLTDDNVNEAQEVYRWLGERSGVISDWKAFFDDPTGKGIEIDKYEFADRLTVILESLTEGMFDGAGAYLSNEEQFQGFNKFMVDLFNLLPDTSAAENLRTVWTLLSDEYGHAAPNFYEQYDEEDGDMADDISRGTSGTEQRLDENNRLMLMMNNILTQILNKPNTFTFSPTPSFGRVVNQSKEMYERSGGMTASP